MSHHPYSEGTVLQSDSTKTTTTYTKSGVFHSETTSREETRMIIAVLRKDDGQVAVLRGLVANFPHMLLAQPGDKVKWRYIRSSLSEFEIDFTARKSCAK